MRRKHVLLIGGRDHNVDKVTTFGLRYSMVQVPELVTERHSRGARQYAVLDYRHIETLLPCVRAWHAQDSFDAVVSFTEYGLEPASRCALDLGVPGDNLRAVLQTRDKTRTRDLLNRHGLSPVRHRVCTAPADALDFMAGLGGQPVVLKPPAGGLSEGVYLVETPAQLGERWGWTSEVADGHVLAEEYLTGPEYSVESVSRNGEHEVVMITEKLTTGLPRFVEIGHQAPARLDPGEQARIVELIDTFLDLIEQKTGPVHTELRLTPSGPRLIEAQTRIGGDQIWEMCEMVTGVDMIAETLAALLDLPTPPRTRSAGAAAIRFFAYEDARVLDVQGVPTAARAPGVVRVHCTLQPGQQLGSLVSSDSRQGYLLCAGVSTDDAVAKAAAAYDLVRVDRAPLEGMSTR
jgi:biotin carboxylase